MMTDGNLTEGMVTAETGQGTEIRGTLLRLTRHLIAFEIYSPNLILRLSEVLTNFRIVVQDRTIYSGKAVINNLVNTAALIICEASLDESGWVDVDLSCLTGAGGSQQRQESY